MQAALDGSREIAFTILSMTLSLTAVFIPVLFMGGVVGRLMHEFAVTIAASILVSGVVSLTLTPMLCSRFLKPPHDDSGTAGSTTSSKPASTGCATPMRGRSTRRSRFKAVTMTVSALLLVGDRRISSRACRRVSFRAWTSGS